MNRYEEYKSIKIPIKSLMNRYEEESKEVRQIILCRMLKYNEMHLFRHVLLTYTLKVFLVYYAMKIVTTCLYNEGKVSVFFKFCYFKDIKNFKNIFFYDFRRPCILRFIMNLVFFSCYVGHINHYQGLILFLCERALTFSFP